jgi:hypothetical protein
MLASALLLALAGPAGAQAVSAPIGATAATLHVHPVSWDDFPINTQAASFGPWDDVAHVPLPTTTATCVPNPSPLGTPFQEYHVWRGYSSPGFVEYASEQDGHPRTAPERQMGYDATLAGQQVTLHWFLRTTAGLPAPGAGPDPNDAPVVVPNVVVDATLRSSVGAASADDTSYDQGPVVAEGRSATAVLAVDHSQGAVHSMAGGHHVYELTVPMQVRQPALGGAGFVLRVEARLDNSACPGDGQSVMPNLVAPYADAERRPRLELHVLDPLRIVSLRPEFNNGTVLVRAQAQSVWGNHDVQLGPAWTPYDAAPNVTLSVDGPGGHRDVAPAAVVQRTHEYFHHADPIDLIWAFDRANLTAGTYWLNLTLTNLQGTATATAHAAFTVGPDAAYPALPGGAAPQVDARRPEAPALPLPLVAAALATLAARARGKRTLNKR